MFVVQEEIKSSLTKLSLDPGKLDLYYLVERHLTAHLKGLKLNLKKKDQEVTTPQRTKLLQPKRLLQGQSCM